MFELSSKLHLLQTDGPYNVVIIIIIHGIEVSTVVYNFWKINGIEENSHLGTTCP